MEYGNWFTTSIACSIIRLRETILQSHYILITLYEEITACIIFKKTGLQNLLTESEEPYLVIIRTKLVIMTLSYVILFQSPCDCYRSG